MLSLTRMKVSECFKQTKSKVEYYDDKIQTFGVICKFEHYEWIGKNISCSKDSIKNDKV